MLIIGNDIRNAFVGNAGITSIWLGDKLVWPLIDFDDKLLVEDGRGILCKTNGSSREFVLQIDRNIPNVNRDYISMRTDADDKSLLYEGKNNYPYEIEIALEQETL